jgi:hypothetical protein
VLDEPAAQQTDPTVLDLQLRAISTQVCVFVCVCVCVCLCVCVCMCTHTHVCPQPPTPCHFHPGVCVCSVCVCVCVCVCTHTYVCPQTPTPCHFHTGVCVRVCAVCVCVCAHVYICTSSTSNSVLLLYTQAALQPTVVPSIENAAANPQKISTWVQNMADLHRGNPAPKVH